MIKEKIKRKKLKITLFATLVIPVVLTGILAIPWMIFGIGTMIVPNPSRPTLTEGRFPFIVEYSILGEPQVLEGVFIAEFDGFTRSGTDRLRVWKGWIEGTDSSLLHIPIDDYRRLNINLGTARFYMGDGDRGMIFPNFSVTLFRTAISNRDLSKMNTANILAIYHTTQSTVNFTNRLDILYEEYGIQILRYEFSEPILNNLH